MLLEETNSKHYDKLIPTPLFRELKENEKMLENSFSLQGLDFFKANLLIFSVELCHVSRPALMLDVSTLRPFFEIG
jgi:hypothetical protein